MRPRIEMSKNFQFLPKFPDRHQGLGILPLLVIFAKRWRDHDNLLEFCPRNLVPYWITYAVASRDGRKSREISKIGSEACDRPAMSPLPVLILRISTKVRVVLPRISGAALRIQPVREPADSIASACLAASASCGFGITHRDFEYPPPTPRND